MFHNVRNSVVYVFVIFSMIDNLNSIMQMVIVKFFLN